MNKLTNQEQQMYDVMGAIADAKVPVIYKGAMVTKLILQEYDFDDFTRETRDIDASWMDSPPPMERLTEMLNNALVPLGLSAAVTRKHGEQMSACYDIFVSASGELSMTIDIDMRASAQSRTYHFGDATFQGVTPDSVIADKISAVSSDRVFRRAKDLIDLYALAHCVTVKAVDIYGILERENRTIGTFDAFINRQDDLRYAYEKLRRMDTKPEFSVIYGFLTRFLTPFIEGNTISLVWNRDKSNWMAETSKEILKNKPETLLGEFAEAKRTADSVPKKGPAQSRDILRE